jgi:hypothetical protein
MYNGADSSRSMTHVGKNWNQLIYELNGWLKFGREVDSARNAEENKAVESVR